MNLSNRDSGCRVAWYLSTTFSRFDPGQLDDGRIVNMEATEKQRAIEALRTLPEHATLDDAIERLCFIAKVEEGLRQSDARQLVTHDEVKKQFLS